MASLMRWDPFGDLLALPRDMERMFEWPRMALRQAGSETGSQLLVPTMDVMRRGDDMVVRMELPGIKQEDIDISVADDVLTISGERKEVHETHEEDYMLRESSWGSFERRVALPRGVNADTIHAEFTDGMLEVTVPEAHMLEEPKAHHVAIGAGTKH